MAGIIQQTTLVIEVGVQGPRGPRGIQGQGSIKFDTVEAMNLVVGDPGDIAYCMDSPDQHWKWSMNQGIWVPAF